MIFVWVLSLIYVVRKKWGGHVTVDIYIIEALFQTLKMCQIMFQK